ncbi:MAG TPA: septal ring lytic transglycosylase RlpA family protein [Kofleriaceae bacterium]|nr:septal ring lytic transglycosylase RlpA family protein [Kofleriaceae bacterium]
MLALRWLIVLACAGIVITACGGKPKRVAVTEPSKVIHGYATWYGGGHHGGPTASGERYNKRALTAAHRTLPMNTRVRVTNTRNGKSVILRINDRGPYGKRRERIIDVSERAAEILGMVEAGVVPITLEVLDR